MDGFLRGVDLLKTLASRSAISLDSIARSPSLLDKMPSFRSLSASLFPALSVAQSALGLSSPVFRDLNSVSASASCSSTQLSCHNTSAVENLCCFNAPGGSLLQTQFWDTDPSAGPSDSWTIHGLWPDNCDGTYQSNCDDSRDYTNITAILNQYGKSDLLTYMNQYWVSNDGSAESFWEHEFGKHATCISTLDPSCYSDYQPGEEVPDFFQKVVDLFKTLPTYQWLSDAGITPSSSKTYSSSDIQAALSKNRDNMQVYLGCESGALDEVWYFFNVKGSVQTGDFEPAAPVGSKSTCPSTGIKYLPKSGGGGGGGGSPTTTSPSSPTTSTSPTGTGPAFSGKGYLNAVTSGSQEGCIISDGTWYTTGTCATFTAASSGDGFTLKSSKGDCAISSGELTCGSSVDSATVFAASSSKLSYDGHTTFYADAVPSGSTKGTVYSASGHDVSLTIEWQST